MEAKRILTIQDISCIGQCSITVALPVISACGIETAVLPSAILSTHTTGFHNFTMRDLSSDMPAICAHWQEEGLKFDAVYTGYLGGISQIDSVLNIAEHCRKEAFSLIVDPAMADHGVLYPGLKQSYVAAMRRLCAKADYLLPNVTEACLLCNVEYKETYDEVFIHELLDGLTQLGGKHVILTGVSYRAANTGVAIYSDGCSEYYEHEQIPKSFHGTGDIFSSVFTGALMRGCSGSSAARIAADFTLQCIRHSMGDPTHWYGVRFEPLLYRLNDMLP